MPLELGDLQVTSVVATRFALDGGAMFGVVPRPAWSRAHAPDAQNRIALVARVLVVTSARHGYRALLDVGLGDAWTDRERELYALDNVALPDALTRAGVAPESITDVVLSHLHWDHAGGLATRGDAPDAPPRSALPRARLHVGAAHLAWAERAAAKDRGSFRAPELEQARAAAARRIEAGEVLPGLWAHRSEGHTAGLLVFELRGGGARVVFPADLLPTRSHARPAWGMAYDNFPLTVADEKATLVADCAADGALIALEHDPDVAAIRVRVESDRWIAEAATELVDAP
jgi:glyoxylase-like metal-dependent hydrolase (beta-lactamase superfamily II)